MGHRRPSLPPSLRTSWTGRTPRLAARGTGPGVHRLAHRGRRPGRHRGLQDQRRGIVQAQRHGRDALTGPGPAKADRARGVRVHRRRPWKVGQNLYVRIKHHTCGYFLHPPTSNYHWPYPMFAGEPSPRAPITGGCAGASAMNSAIREEGISG